MVFGRSRFTLISIYVILCFALCAKPIASQGLLGKEEVLPPPLPKLGASSSFDQINDPAQQLITHLEELRKHIENYASWFPQKKSCWATPESAKPCCDQCQESFGVASECAKGGVESLNKQDIAKAKCDITNIATNVQKCDDCFEQTGNGGDKAVKDINTYLKDQVAYYLMAFVDSEDGVQKLSVNQNDKLYAPSLPKIGVRKSSIDQTDNPANAAIAHLEWMKEYIESWKPWFQESGQCPWLSPEIKKCYDECPGNIDAAMDTLNVAIESLNKQDLTKAYGDISGINTNMEICNGCFTQSGKDAGKFLTDWTKEMSEACIKDLKESQNGVQKLSVNQNDDGTKRSIEQLEGYKQYDL